MSFQRAPAGIVRSIRQVSLFRTWVRLRGAAALPRLDDYVPDIRCDDAADAMTCEVREGEVAPRFRCIQAGARLVQANDGSMLNMFLDQCMAEGVVRAAKPIWNACVHHRLPLFSIVATADRNGCPVTIEQLYLPFANDSVNVAHILGSFHAVSIEGRFRLQGLLRQPSKIPRQWAVIVDPSFVAVSAAQDHRIAV